MNVVIHSRYPEHVLAPRGGVESATVNLIEGLKNRSDVKVSVVTAERGAKGYRIGEVDGTPVHRVGVPNVPMALDVCNGPGSRLLRHYIEALEPDIVHFHESHGLGAHTWPLPHVMTVHGFDSRNLPAAHSRFWRVRAPVWRLVERRHLAHHKNLISIAPYVADEIRRVSSARIFAICNAVPRELFEMSPSASRPVIFFAGWIDRRKNLLGLLRALNEIVARSHSNVRLRVAGTASDPDYWKLISSYIAERGLAGQVEFLGQLGQPQLRAELSAARVVGLLSYQENAPMIVSEAMSLGVPVLTSNVCGMPKMVAHGESGYLVDPDDYRGASQFLEDLLFSDAVHARMSRAAREYARQAYHPDEVAAQTASAYEEIVGSFG